MYFCNSFMDSFQFENILTFFDMAPAWSIQSGWKLGFKQLRHTKYQTLFAPPVVQQIQGPPCNCKSVQMANSEYHIISFTNVRHYHVKGALNSWVFFWNTEYLLSVSLFQSFLLDLGSTLFAVEWGEWKQLFSRAVQQHSLLFLLQFCNILVQLDYQNFLGNLIRSKGFNLLWPLSHIGIPISFPSAISMFQSFKWFFCTSTVALHLSRWSIYPHTCHIVQVTTSRCKSILKTILIWECRSSLDSL